MGAVWSFLGSPRSAEFSKDPGLDQIDIVTGLSIRQKKVIAENWKIVLQDMQKNGVDLFIEVFRAHPSYQKQFKSFADVPLEELPNNKKIAAHGTNVMYALSSFVDNLDNVECLKELLFNTGERHGRRKATGVQFDNLAVVFVALLQEKLGEKFTPFARKAWQQALKVMNSIIKDGIEHGAR